MREGFRNKGIDIDEFKGSVKRLRAVNIDVNYVMNSPVIGENYFDKNHLAIIKTVNELQSIGVNVITSPVIQLVELIKEKVPGMKVYLSTVADTRHPSELDDLKKIGVDRVIPSFFVNREFQFLKYAKEIGQPLELLLQSTCRYNCIMRKNHAISEALMEDKPKNLKFKDYHVKSCAKQFDEEFPFGFLKSPWIMPEDLDKYQKICGDVIFKVNGRTLSIDEKLFIAECYLRRKSPKNLGNLFAATSHDSLKEGNKYRKIFVKSSDLREPLVYYGKKYSNFIDYFIKENPSFLDYVKYCKFVSDKIKDDANIGVKTGLEFEEGIEKYPTLLGVV